MLFRTVYGIELPLIYQSIADGAYSHDAVRKLHLASYGELERVSSQSVDDAISFLESAYLVQGNQSLTAATLGKRSFRLALFQNLCRISSAEIPPKHPLDSLFLTILDQLFIQPDQLYLRDLHSAVNQLTSVTEVGGLSKEKVRAWQRVLTAFGIGQRIQSGYQCVYSPQLIEEILKLWSRREGNLQAFLERHFSRYLPYLTQSGGISQAISVPLNYLANQGKITLEQRQDSPARSYFGEKRIKFIRYEEAQ